MINGQGRYVDIAMADCAVSLLQTSLAMASNGDHAPGVMDGTGDRVGTTTRTLAPFDTFQCKDAKIALVGYQQHHWKSICELIGRPEMISGEDGEYETLKDRSFQWNPESNLKMKAQLEEALSAKNRDEWIEIFEGAGLAAGPVNGLSKVLKDEQLTHRNMLSKITVPMAGSSGPKGKELIVPGNPVKISGFSDGPVRRPMPMIDEHGDAIRARL